MIVGLGARWRRLGTVALLIGLLCGSFAVPFGGSGRAQEESGLNEPPVAGEFSLASTGDTGTVELAAEAAVDPSSRAASQAFFYDQYNSENADIAWTGSFGSCTAGTTASDFRATVLDQIAYYRAMAGVPAYISLSTSYNSGAQQAALMMGAQQSLSHSPDSGWECYTSAGDNAAANSNLAIGANGTNAIDLYMRDPGASNAAVGHRRWILYPQTQTFGTGDVESGGQSGASDANALWVFDGNYGGPRPATRDGFVAWPPQGYVPYQVTFTRWSFSYPGANFGSASVSVTSGGQAVQVSTESIANGYGENTLVWRMEGRSDGSAWPKPSTDKRYTVTIRNVVVGGASRSFTYDVIVFDPATSGGPAPTPVSNAGVSISPTRSTVNSWVDYSISGFPANASVDISWKRLTGSTIAIGSVQTDGSGVASGRFRVPATPGGANQEIRFTSGTVSKTALFEVAPRIKVNTDPAIRGQTVDVSLRGYARQEEVRIRWKKGDTWVEVGRVTTSNTGSANIDVIVPDWASTGANSVRGDGTVFRQQTNTVMVEGDISPPGSPSPSATATPSVTATATVTETATPTETVTSEPAVTETPTEMPTETEVPTEVPTDVPTEVPTDVPTEAPTDVPTDVPTEALPSETVTETP